MDEREGRLTGDPPRKPSTEASESTISEAARSSRKRSTRHLHRPTAPNPLKHTIPESTPSPVRQPSIEPFEDEIPEIPEGEPIPGTPSVVWRNNIYPYPVKKREQVDSHEVLRQLSRALRKSSSPTSQTAPPRTPVVTGAWVDTPLPTGGHGLPMPTPSDLEDEKELSACKPAAEDLIQRLSPGNFTSRPKLSSQSPLKYSGQLLPKSILEEIVNDAKSLHTNDSPTPATNSLPESVLEDIMNDTLLLHTNKTITGAANVHCNSDSEEDPILNLGSSTVQSLEELIVKDEDDSNHLAATPPSLETPSEISETSLSPPSPTTHLLSRFRNVPHVLRENGTRLARLARTISSPPATRSQIIARTDEEDEECNLGGEVHDFIFPCAKCGSRAPNTDLEAQHLRTIRDSIYSMGNKVVSLGKKVASLCDNFTDINDSFTSVTITLPLPCFWRRSKADRRPRWTWIGMITLLLYSVYLTESWARHTYCHPRFARTMVGYGVDINAPRPPFVFVKAAYQYTPLGTVVAPFWDLSRLLAKVFWGGGVMQPMYATSSRVASASMGPELNLMDDEYL